MASSFQPSPQASLRPAAQAGQASPSGTALWQSIVADLSLARCAEAAVHPHVADERGDLFHAADGESTEYEYLTLLHSLVLATKPTMVLETGTGRGFGTLALASALRLNGVGRLITTDTGESAEARAMCRHYVLDDIVSFVTGRALEYLASYRGVPFDFAFFDSDIRERFAEYRALADNRKLAPGCLVAFHDTSSLRDKVPVDRTYWECTRSLQPSIEFPLSRGLTIARLQPGAGQQSPTVVSRAMVEPNALPNGAHSQASTPATTRNFRHSGERGDIIYSLPVMRASGGGVMLVDARSVPGGKTPFGEDAARAMLPLLEAQLYVHSARLFDCDDIQVDFDRFRTVGQELYREHLSYSHCRGVGVDPRRIDLSAPWLFVQAKPMAEIIVSRTGRREGQLDWSRLKRYQKRCLFVGTWSEYSTFRSRCNLAVPFFHACDYLELAEVIAGARLVVSDQTFAFALAEGLKVPRVLEVFAAAPNCLPQSANGHTELTDSLLERYCGS